MRLLDRNRNVILECLISNILIVTLIECSSIYLFIGVIPELTSLGNQLLTKFHSTGRAFCSGKDMVMLSLKQTTMSPTA